MARRRRARGRAVRRKVVSFYSKKGHRRARKGGRYVAGAVVGIIRRNKARGHRRHRRR